MRADGGRRKMVVAVLQPSDLRHHFAGRSGRCRAVWRQVWPLRVCLAANLAAAGLSGGKFWPLQGRCRAVTLAPLLMVLLL